MMAVVAGGLKLGVYQPVTFPGWDLRLADDRVNVRECLMEMDPDVLCMAFPKYKLTWCQEFVQVSLQH